MNLWTPFNVSTGLVCYLDARIAATITLSSGKVSSWSDRSGKGNTFTQATGASQPVYNTTGINGLPSVTGDGAAKSMARGANLTGISFANGNWYAGVYLPNDTLTSTIFGDNGAGVGSRNPCYFGNQFINFGHTTLAWSSLTTGSPIIQVGRTFAGGTTTPQYIALNGAAEQTNSPVRDNIAGTAWTVLSYPTPSGFFNGELGIVILGNGTLSDDDKLKLEGFLAWAYLIPSNLPSTHPYRGAPPRL